METINEWKDLTFNSLQVMGEKIMTVIPNLIGAILILLIGWLITKVILFILKKTLKFAKIDTLTEKIYDSEVFGNTNLKFKTSTIILSFVKWIMLLVFLIVAADIMNWEIVSTEIGNLLGYLPKLFSAIALFMLGIYVANFVKKAIKGLFESFDLNGAKIISSMVFYIITVIITITSLNQAGINTDIITNNLTIILGAFLFAIAIGFGFGSKDIIQKLLLTFYSRKNYSLGEKILINGIEGEIEAIDNICMTIKTTSGKTIIPIKDVIENTVNIKN